ncbi:hypothetical protein OG21DRAFT_1525438 [Imleria badia]|nr:hypothetical protein OG21DRAFT_1525438 [Imleria badia]
MANILAKPLEYTQSKSAPHNVLKLFGVKILPHTDNAMIYQCQVDLVAHLLGDEAFKGLSQILEPAVLNREAKKLWRRNVNDSQTAKSTKLPKAIHDVLYKLTTSDDVLVISHNILAALKNIHAMSGKTLQVIGTIICLAFYCESFKKHRKFPSIYCNFANPTSGIYSPRLKSQIGEPNKTAWFEKICLNTVFGQQYTMFAVNEAHSAWKHNLAHMECCTLRYNIKMLIVMTATLVTTCPQDLYIIGQ